MHDSWALTICLKVILIKGNWHITYGKKKSMTMTAQHILQNIFSFVPEQTCLALDTPERGPWPFSDVPHIHPAHQELAYSIQGPLSPGTRTRQEVGRPRTRWWVSKTIADQVGAWDSLMCFSSWDDSATLSPFSLIFTQYSLWPSYSLVLQGGTEVTQQESTYDNLIYKHLQLVVI